MSVSNEAIEAAMSAADGLGRDGNNSWSDAAIMSAALTAAAPYIQAAALRDAAESFQGVMIGFGGRDPRTSGSAWLRARADQLEGKTK